MQRKTLIYAGTAAAVFLLSFFILIDGCSPRKGELVKTAVIKDNEYDPAKWGAVFPVEYESWLKTREPRPKGKSFYKRGWDTDKIVWDKLSEFPFMALLFNGWGFGIEYNEPRGHYYMMIDQAEIDQSRTKAGGACITCKSPYMGKLLKEQGKALFRMPYKEAVGLIPKEHQNLGVSCIDCHDNKTMDLKVSRWTVHEGFRELGKTDFTRQEMRTAVCAQCHVTYFIPKDEKMQSTNVVFPWKGSAWGRITIENIIKVLKSDPANREWTQKVTGFKMAFLRHPEFEFFTNGSVHFRAGLACADCHMPYKRVGGFKISDHNIMSPLKNDLFACGNCHPQSIDRLKDRIKAIQDRTVSLLIRSGYQTAVAAKLFEIANTHKARGKIINMALYEKAKEYYEEAFYRGVFMGAENSIGFHNPTEAGRILGDAIAFASKAESLLRQSMSAAGINLPDGINLELGRYLSNRGGKPLNFRNTHEFRDPFNTQEKFTPPGTKGI